MKQLARALRSAGFQTSREIRRARDRAIARALKTRDESGRFRSTSEDKRQAAELSRRLREVQ